MNYEKIKMQKMKFTFEYEYHGKTVTSQRCEEAIDVREAVRDFLLFLKACDYYFDDDCTFSLNNCD